MNSREKLVGSEILLFVLVYGIVKTCERAPLAPDPSLGAIETPGIWPFAARKRQFPVPFGFRGFPEIVNYLEVYGASERLI